MTSKIQIAKQIATAAILAFILDAIVLGWLAKEFYNKQLHFVLRPEFGVSQLIATICVYSLIALGQYYFVKPTEHKWKVALHRGALFGFISYGIYELTNYALIITWSLKLVAADIIWGAALNAIIAIVLWKTFSKKA